MSSAEDSLAKMSAAPVNAPAFPASVQDCTGNWCEPFAWYDRATQSWRTWQRCLTMEWAEFSETWPRAGLTLNGIAYRRAPSAPLTSEIGFLLLPTPTASTGGVLTVLRGYETKHAGTLPTPAARDTRSGKASEETHGKNSRPLNEVLCKMGGNQSGRMNPRFREWMMMFPIGWSELRPPVTPSSR